MLGRAFRCDTCGRVGFLPNAKHEEDEPIDPVPPPGWVGVAAVPPEGTEWDDPLHFCSWICLQGYTSRLLTIPAPEHDSDEAAAAASAV